MPVEIIMIIKIPSTPVPLLLWGLSIPSALLPCLPSASCLCRNALSTQPIHGAFTSLPFPFAL